MPLIDLAGVYCPMGCGATLHASTSSGLIACLNPGCPDRAAARKILSNPEHLDVVLVGPDSWTVLHPLRERLGDLFTCPVLAACQAQLEGIPPEGDGYYRAHLDEAGKLQLEHLPEGFSVIPGASAGG